MVTSDDVMGCLVCYVESSADTAFAACNQCHILFLFILLYLIHVRWSGSYHVFILYIWLWLANGVYFSMVYFIYYLKQKALFRKFLSWVSLSLLVVARPLQANSLLKPAIQLFELRPKLDLVRGHDQQRSTNRGYQRFKENPATRGHPAHKSEEANHQHQSTFEKLLLFSYTDLDTSQITNHNTKRQISISQNTNRHHQPQPQRLITHRAPSQPWISISTNLIWFPILAKPCQRSAKLFLPLQSHLKLLPQSQRRAWNRCHKTLHQPATVSS